MTVHVSIGRCLIDDILNKKRMTQTDLAIATGIPKSQISDYIKERRGMSLKNAKLIAYVLKCNIDDLYEWIIK